MWQACKDIGSGPVSHRVEPHLNQLLLKMGVPEVLDFVVGTSGKVGSDC